MTGREAETTEQQEAAMRHRALGAVIGSAVGDALGAPFEFGPAGQYSKRFPAPVLGGIGEMTGGGGFGWAPGEFTDDTQMAVVQAMSILANDGIANNGIDGADLFERFRTWAYDASDVGNQTRAVLGSREPWHRAAEEHFRRHPDRAGNGALMRATPTAVRFARASATETVEAAFTTAGVTHGGPHAGWGTALFHLMVRASLTGGDPFDALADALDTLPDDQHRYRDMLAPDWSPHDPGRAGAELPNGTVWGCLAEAVWAVRSTSTFADAITTTIDLGGDTDTVAAVAGGLAGAIHGIAGVPSRWATYVHGHVTTPDGATTCRLADLQELTLRLLGHRVALDTAPGEACGPTEIAPGLHAADLTAAAGVPTDWAVMSFCRVGDRFDAHPVRRLAYLVDTERAEPDLEQVVADAVDTIDAFLAESRPTVVHCHHGASRTGLILRAWLMRQHRWDATIATEHLAERWPRLSQWNERFDHFLHTTWTQRTEIR